VSSPDHAGNGVDQARVIHPTAVVAVMGSGVVPHQGSHITNAETALVALVSPLGISMAKGVGGDPRGLQEDELPAGKPIQQLPERIAHWLELPAADRRADRKGQLDLAAGIEIKRPLPFTLPAGSIERKHQPVPLGRLHGATVALDVTADPQVTVNNLQRSKLSGPQAEESDQRHRQPELVLAVLPEVIQQTRQLLWLDWRGQLISPGSGVGSADQLLRCSPSSGIQRAGAPVRVTAKRSRAATSPRWRLRPCPPGGLRLKCCLA